MKPPPPLNPIRTQLASMRMVYYAMAAPIIIFSAILYFLVETAALGEPDYSLAPLLQTIAMIFVPLSLAVGYFAFKSGLGKIDSNIPLQQYSKRLFSSALSPSCSRASFFFLASPQSFFLSSCFSVQTPIPLRSI